MRKQSGFLSVDLVIYLSIYSVLAVLFIGGIINEGYKRIDAKIINNDAAEILSAVERWHSRKILSRGGRCITSPEVPTLIKLKNDNLVNSNLASNNTYGVDIEYLKVNGNVNIAYGAKLIFKFKNENDLYRIEPFLKNDGIDGLSAIFTSSFNQVYIDHKRLDINSGCYL